MGAEQNTKHLHPSAKPVFGYGLDFRCRPCKRILTGMNHLLRDTLRLIKFVRQYFLESLRSEDGMFTGCDFFLRAKYIPEKNI